MLTATAATVWKVWNEHTHTHIIIRRIYKYVAVRVRLLCNYVLLHTFRARTRVNAVCMHAVHAVHHQFYTPWPVNAMSAAAVQIFQKTTHNKTTKGFRPKPEMKKGHIDETIHKLYEQIINHRFRCHMKFEQTSQATQPKRAAADTNITGNLCVCVCVCLLWARCDLARAHLNFTPDDDFTIIRSLMSHTRRCRSRCRRHTHATQTRRSTYTWSTRTNDVLNLSADHYRNGAWTTQASKQQAGTHIQTMMKKKKKRTRWLWICYYYYWLCCAVCTSISTVLLGWTTEVMPREKKTQSNNTTKNDCFVSLYCRFCW